MTVIEVGGDPATTARQARAAQRLERLRGHVTKSRRADFDELIAAVRNPGLEAGLQWAHIDLFAAFDPDTVIDERRNGLRSLAGYLMFVPLILTWFGLHGALSAYSQMAPEEREPSFFAQWIEGFEGWRSGFLPVPSLGELALIVALVFAIVILLGLASDASGNKVLDRRSELRGALTDASRTFDVRYPQSTAGTVAALDGLATRIAEMGSDLEGISQSLIATQEEVLRTTAGAVEQMAGMLTQGLAQNTEAMIASGEAVALLAGSTQLDEQRRSDYERIQAHMADSALELKESADRLQAAVAGVRVSHG